MQTGSLSRLLTVLLVIFSFVNLKVESQSGPCTTPSRTPGLCVPIERCKNLHKIVSIPGLPIPSNVTDYINRAACSLPNVKRSICCQSQQVVREPRHPKVHLLPLDCGLSVNDRIANGNETRVFSYPWMAVLRYEQKGTLSDRCGGSLINKRYVLTAAHCIHTAGSFRLVGVRLGEHTKNQTEDCDFYYDKYGKEIERDCADPAEDYGIESFVVHPKHNKPALTNDIGLLRLKKDVVMKDHIKPICLPVTPELRTLQLKNLIVTGWGATENAPGSNVLMEATVPSVDNVKCQQIYRKIGSNVFLIDGQMCAGGQNKVDSCKGDSGGPLGLTAVYNGQARFVQFGLVSFGINSCGQESVPGVYSRVSSYMNWILDNMEP